MTKRAKNLIPATLEEHLARIDALQKQRIDIEAELEILTGRRREMSTMPLGFDYKDEIHKVFKENPDKILGLDDIVGQIALTHKFTPDRSIVLKQTTLLADRHKKVERIPGRRGKYRLAKEVNIESGSEQK